VLKANCFYCTLDSVYKPFVQTVPQEKEWVIKAYSLQRKTHRVALLVRKVMNVEVNLARATLSVTMLTPHFICCQNQPSQSTVKVDGQANCS